MLGLVGNNGAGKTTLFRLILDLLKADEHLLAEYNKETGATILVSSHNLNHTTDVCPRIVLLENGVIIRDIDNSAHTAEQELESYFNVDFITE